MATGKHRTPMIFARTLVNAETLAATKTLVTGDKMVQWFDPNGVSRDVVLPAEASSTNLLFIILNTADGAGEDLVVKNAAAATIATLGPGMSGIFSCDGTNWKWENDSGVFYDSVNGRVGIGTTVLSSGKLQVVGNVFIAQSVGTSYLDMVHSGTQTWHQGITTDNTSSYIIGNDSGGTFANKILTLTNTGNVGIGTITPSVKLAIADDDTGFNLIAADSLGTIVGGVEGHRITEAAGAIDHVLTGIVKTPTTQTLTGAGAVDIVSAMTLLVTTGTDALTLANGAAGQEKYIVMKTDGGVGTLTPTSLLNGTTITFDDVGDSAHLIYMDTGWVFMGGTATLA